MIRRWGLVLAGLVVGGTLVVWNERASAQKEEGKGVEKTDVETGRVPPPAPKPRPLAGAAKAVPLGVSAVKSKGGMSLTPPPAPASAKAPPTPRPLAINDSIIKPVPIPPGSVTHKKMAAQDEEVAPAAFFHVVAPTLEPPLARTNRDEADKEDKKENKKDKPELGSSQPVPVKVPALAAPPSSEAGVSASKVEKPGVATTPDSSPATSIPAPLGGQNPTLYLEKIGPATATLGEPVAYELIVRNTGTTPVFNVRVQDELLAKTKLISARPKPDLSGDQMVWTAPSLEPGAELRYKVEIQPSGEGELYSRAMATFSSACSLQTRVIQPRLALSLTGPETVQIGEQAAFLIQVTNSGSGPATNVVLHDHLPAGLKHPQGSDIEADLGTLAPGESKKLTLKTSAIKGGRLVNEATAISENGLKANAQAAVFVAEPSLHLRATGPKRRVLDREAEFDIEVVNSGTAPVHNVLITDNLPVEMDFLGCSEGGHHDAVHRTVTWKLDSMKPGQRHGLSVKIVTRGVGDVINRVTAQGDPGLETVAEAPLHIEGAPALMLEVVDRDDPVEVGSQTTYEIRVVNQGTSASTGIQVVATLPKELTPVEAIGPTGHRIQGQQVLFEPMPKLAARADALFRIKVSAQHPGDVRFKVQLSANQLQSPILEEESTRIYSDKDTSSLLKTGNRE